MTVTIEAVKKHGTATSEETDFEAIFHEHWPRVFGVLCRLTDDPDEAQDLALEVFCRLYQQPPAQNNNAQSIGGWLYRVATNLGYNALRAWKRRARYEQQAGVQALESENASDPAEAAERRIERQHVRHTLAQMKSRSAQLLILRHSGLSYAEIAAALKLSSSSVGTLLARAEQEFEHLYQKLER